jgi:hypothetical protein
MHEPIGVGMNNGKNDGTYWLPYDLYRKLFEFVTWVSPNEQPNMAKTPAAAQKIIDDYIKSLPPPKPVKQNA